MKREQGFSLIELLIVVAIIAIIAAIAIPSLLTSRMAANEASAIQGCRTVGSAEIAFAATANQQFDVLGTLITNGFLDNRFTNGIDGYQYADGDVLVAGGTTFPATTAGSSNFGVLATPDTNMGRFVYGIGTDQVVRYQATGGGYAGNDPMPAGTGIGAMTGAGS